MVMLKTPSNGNVCIMSALPEQRTPAWTWPRWQQLTARCEAKAPLAAAVVGETARARCCWYQRNPAGCKRKGGAFCALLSEQSSEITSPGSGATTFATWKPHSFVPTVLFIVRIGFQWNQAKTACRNPWAKAIPSKDGCEWLEYF